MQRLFLMLLMSGLAVLSVTRACLMLERVPAKKRLREKHHRRR